MPDDFEIRGVEEFLRVSKELKRFPADLRKDFNKQIRTVAKPVITSSRQNALATLPRRGGLAQIVAREPQRVALATGTDPGVRVIVGKRRGAARAAESGTIRHPVFNRVNANGRRVFVAQAVRPNWFSDAANVEAGEVARQIENVVSVFSDRIARG